MSNTKIKAGQFSGIVSNGTDGYFLMTNGDGTMSWEAAGVPSPTVTSVTYPGDDTAADPAGGQSVTLTGTNFASGATATIGGTTVPSVSFVSATELTITTPAKAAGDYDIVVTNTDGGTATFVDGISYNGIPAWTTASGSLGTLASNTTISTITLQASEPDAGSITFNITSGALPTGLSLTGANIDGTTSKETAETLYNFTVTAIDDENQSTPRAFSITVEKYIVPAPENFEIVTYTGNGGTQAITSKIGKAASFNGSSSYIDTGIRATLENKSISFWFYYTSAPASSQSLFAGIEGGSKGQTIRLTTTQIQFQLQAASSTASAALSTLNTNQFNHVVATINGTVITLYINGVSQSTGDATGNSSTSTQTYYIGARGTSGSADEYFNGKIDQVRIFDKALSSAEVTTLYNETYDSSTKSTTDIFNDGSGVALYELDEDANTTPYYPYGTGDIDSGQSAVFNGSSSYVTVNDSADLRLTGDYTISFWFNTNAIGSTQRLINKDDALDFSAGYAFTLNADGRFTISHNDGSNNQNWGPSNTFSANTWYHIAVTYSDTANLRTLYINGSSAATQATNTNIASGTDKLFFGTYGSTSAQGQYFNGKLDQVRIYSSALSASDVEALASETNVPTANLVAHYKLDGNANDETGSYNGTTSNITYSDPAEFPLIAYNGTPTNVNFLGMAFQPDFVWIKRRDSGGSHYIFDSVRGVYKALITEQNYAEINNSTYLTSFDSNGFSLGTNSALAGSGNTYVSWCLKAGGAAVSNTDGVTSGSVTAVTSQVSANQDAGFSICEFTTPSSGKPSWGHGLSQEPELIIVKNAGSTGDWFIYAPSILGQKELRFTTASATSYSPDFISVDSSKINLGSSSFNIATSSRHINYNFHSVDGYQKVGSYQGTNAAGNFIQTGFRPRFLMTKRATGASGGGWNIFDSTRGTNKRLYPHLSNEEGTDSPEIVTFNSNGFTFNTGDSWNNNNLYSYIYLAIA